MGVKLRVLITGSLFGIFLVSLLTCLIVKGCSGRQEAATKAEKTKAETTEAPEGFCLVDDEEISPGYAKLIQVFQGKADWSKAVLPPLWKPNEIPDYVLEKCLGTGSFGAVYLAKVKNTEQRFALKFLIGFKTPQEIDKALKEDVHLRNEMLTGMLFKDQKIFSAFVGHFKYQDVPHGAYAFGGFHALTLVNSLVMVQKLAPGISLGKEKFSLEQIKEITVQAIVGLVFLQANGFVHRDIKPENLIFDKITNSLTFVDLGLCKYREAPMTSCSAWQKRHKKWIEDGFFDKDGKDTMCGTPLFLPWEIILHQTSFENDLHALGVTIGELLFESAGIPRESGCPTRFRVLAAKMLLHPELKLFFPVLLALRHPHPAGRSCLGAIMACELFEDVDWEKYTHN